MLRRATGRTILGAKRGGSPMNGVESQKTGLRQGPTDTIPKTRKTTNVPLSRLM